MTPPAISVVILTYAEARLPLLAKAIASVRAQRTSAAEIVVVVDGNLSLLNEITRRYPDLMVVLHTKPRGTSGARNTGIASSGGTFVAFLDDDAVADTGWLTKLAACFADARVMVAGATVIPDWLGGRPRWFPEEFDWVVGCSYRGQGGADRPPGGDEPPIPVRNAIGAGMMIRRQALDEVGAFRPDVGRVGPVPVAGDETELCLRIGARFGSGSVVLAPRAVVHHHVSSERVTLRYFHRRCHAEGLTKAALAAIAGHHRSLASESRYLIDTLPRGFARGLGAAIRGDAAGMRRAATIVSGTFVTGVGWLTGVVRGARYDYRGASHGSAPNQQGTHD